MENNDLATEMLHEIKASAKRWFIAFIVTLSLWFATIIGFVCYEYFSLPVDETTITQDVNDVDSSDIKQVVGDDYGESTSESNSEE